MNRCHVCTNVAVNADSALCLTCSDKAAQGDVVYHANLGWMKTPDLMRIVMAQTRTDFEAAHKVICELRGLDPATTAWPEWSSIANTLRWFDRIERSLPDPGPRAATEVALPTDCDVDVSALREGFGRAL